MTTLAYVLCVWIILLILRLFAKDVAVPFAFFCLKILKVTTLAVQETVARLVVWIGVQVRKTVAFGYRALTSFSNWIRVQVRKTVSLVHTAVAWWTQWLITSWTKVSTAGLRHYNHLVFLISRTAQPLYQRIAFLLFPLLESLAGLLKEFYGVLFESLQNAKTGRKRYINIFFLILCLCVFRFIVDYIYWNRKTGAILLFAGLIALLAIKGRKRPVLCSSFEKLLRAFSVLFIHGSFWFLVLAVPFTTVKLALVSQPFFFGLLLFSLMGVIFALLLKLIREVSNRFLLPEAGCFFLFGFLCASDVQLAGVFHTIVLVLLVFVFLYFYYLNRRAFFILSSLWWLYIFYAVLHPIYFNPGIALITHLIAVCLFAMFSFSVFLTRPVLLNAFQNLAFSVKALLLLSAFHLTYGLYVYRGGGIMERQKILSQKTIHSVVLYPYFFHNMKGQLIRYVIPSCDGRHLILAPHSSWPLKNSKLLKVDLRTGKIVRSVRMPVTGGGPAIQDCTRKVFYYPAYTANKVCVIREDDLKILRKYASAEGCGDVAYLGMDEKRGLLYVADDEKGCLQVFKQGNPYPLAVKRGMPFGLPVVDDNGTVVVPSNRVLRFVLSRDGLKQVTSIRPKDAYGMGIGFAYDKQTKTSMVSEFVSGGISFLNEGSNRSDFVHLESFCRYILFDEVRRLLYAVGFIRGNLYVVDVDTKKVVRKYFIGRRSHGLALSQDKNRLYVVTSQGVFYLDMKEAGL